jgi:hypothetical protein
MNDDPPICILEETMLFQDIIATEPDGSWFVALEPTDL